MAKNNKFDLPKIDLPKIDFKALDATLNYAPPPKFTPPPISKELSRSMDKVMKQMDAIDKMQQEIKNYEKNKMSASQAKAKFKKMSINNPDLGKDIRG